MLWTYLLGIVLVMGAELNAFLEALPRRPDGRGEGRLRITAHPSSPTRKALQPVLWYRQRRQHMSQDVVRAVVVKPLPELMQLRPTFQHDHPEIRNLNLEIEKRLTIGQRAADAVANGMGSWRFISIQSGMLVAWIILNIVALITHWDPYPFILLNLVMSFQAAYAAPIIMMSQNRQVQKDRLAAEHDYQINTKAEEEIKAILTHLDYQDDLILQVLHRMEYAGLTGRAERRGAGSS